MLGRKSVVNSVGTIDSGAPVSSRTSERAGVISANNDRRAQRQLRPRAKNAVPPGGTRPGRVGATSSVRRPRDSSTVRNQSCARRPRDSIPRGRRLRSHTQTAATPGGFDYRRGGASAVGRPWRRLEHAYATGRALAIFRLSRETVEMQRWCNRRGICGRYAARVFSRDERNKQLICFCAKGFHIF